MGTGGEFKSFMRCQTRLASRPGALRLGWFTSDIHERFGGQQQVGIITPADHPVVIVITGEEELQHGYADR